MQFFNDLFVPARKLTLAAGLVLCLASSALADNKTVTMTFSDPGNAVDKTVTVRLIDTALPENDPNRVRSIDIVVPANSTAEDKERVIAEGLNSNGVTANRLNGAAGVKLPNINTNVKVEFDNGGTMEHDVLSAPASSTGKIKFNGQFDPFTPDNQPAVFTAGFVTDAGECFVAVRADEIGFQTDGPIICQALFQQLAPQAPNYGVEIVLAGDRLEVYFDPAYSIEISGVQWGTDSPSEGCGGALTVIEPILALDLDQLIGGQNTTLIVTGADPFSTVYFTYGLHTGLTYIPQLDLTIDLLNPVLIGSSPADALGTASLTRLVPPAAAGLELSLQALTAQGTSQVITQTVR